MAALFPPGRGWHLPPWLGAVPQAARAWPLADRLAEEQGRLALWLPVAQGAGVLAYFALLQEPDQAWLWLPAPLIALALWLAGRRPLLAWGVGLVAAASLGFVAAAWHAARMPPPLSPPRGAVQLEGRVAAVELLPEGRRLTLEAVRFDGVAQPRGVRVKLQRGDAATPQPGDAVSLRAMLRPPSAPAYPGAWDFQRAAWFGGPGAFGFAIGRATVEPGAPPVFAGLRSSIEARVMAVLPGAEGSIAAALLTGTQTAIPAAEMQAMRDSGLAHILSVSGLHIAIVMGVSFGLLRLLLAAWPWLALRLPVKAVAAVAALAVGGGYMLLTGSQLPMQRSFAMAALATVAILAGRRALTLRAWALAAAVLLLLSPASLLGASFQMSFAAVLALIAGYDAMRPALRRWRDQGGWWRRALLLAIGLTASSVLAGAATTPFGLFHFGRLQLFGVVANALAVPLTSILVMPAGMAALALMPFGQEAWALVPMGWGVQGMQAVAREVASWPGAALSAPPLPVAGLLLMTAGGLWLCLWRSTWRLAGIGFILAGLAAPWFVPPPDLLVSADARLVALRSAEGVQLQRLSGAANFTRDQWLRLWAVPSAQAFPAEGEGCTRGACRLQPHADGPAAVLLRGDAPSAHCGRAALVLSAEPLRGGCAGSAVIDRFSVWRNGTHAVWLRPEGLRILSDRDWRGDRPWVPPVPQPRRRIAPGTVPLASEPPAE